MVDYIKETISIWNDENNNKLNSTDLDSLAECVSDSYRCYGLYSGLEEATKASPNEPTAEQYKAQIRALQDELNNIKTFNTRLNDRVQNQHKTICVLRERIYENSKS